MCQFEKSQSYSEITNHMITGKRAAVRCKLAIQYKTPVTPLVRGLLVPVPAVDNSSPPLLKHLLVLAPAVEALGEVVRLLVLESQHQFPGTVWLLVSQVLNVYLQSRHVYIIKLVHI